MNRTSQGQQHEQEGRTDDTALVVPLANLDQMLLPVVGGKAANLGELIQAGFPVPMGFCITTAAYVGVSERAGLDTYLSLLEAVSSQESARQIELTTAIRTAICQTALPPEVIDAVTSAYQALSSRDPIPVSVRSSATTEDLPEASFAGQQETFLNVIGIEAVLTAVQRCFASLWTDRATQYRIGLGIAPRDVRLAVVVQRMVEAKVAGVLFTANPLSGKRHQAVIDANPGLGEAVVSGATNPDHFVVNTCTGTIIERRLGEKQYVVRPRVQGGTERSEQSPQRVIACLSDAQVERLSQLGAKVEAHFGTPQDIEWAIDAVQGLFLLQTRTITTLFPLPQEAQSTNECLRIYLAFGVQQGTVRPFTPMGLSALRLIASGFLALIGHPPLDPLTGPGFIQEAASRPFFDVTRALRSALGRRLLTQAMQEAEVQAATGFQHIVTGPRLSLLKTPQHVLARALFLLLVRTRLLWYLLQALVAPGITSTQVQRFVELLRTDARRKECADAEALLAEVEHLLLRSMRRAFRVSPVMLAGMLIFALAKRILGKQATESECQVVLRGSPFNPTTYMNLALWRLSEQVRADQPSHSLLQHIPAAQLAQEYRQGRLSPVLQDGMTQFLCEYGHQGIAELDLGVPGWSEDPTYVFSLLIGYQELSERAHTPEVQFQRASEEAQAMIATLAHRAKQYHRLSGWLASWCLRRSHALAGFREMPRFVLGLILAQARALLWPLGEELVRAERVGQAEDIFFLTLPEVHEALAGADFRERISERRAVFKRELQRRCVPLILLSDGTEPTVQTPKSVLVEGALQGTPASAGIVTGPARVIFDPQEAHLFPGEILVAPTTDPGWTPLFLKASGLVMERGGAMAHGAIVAREYGIPAVVGVAGATERITTGNRVTIDGTAGMVVIEPNE